MDAISQAMFVDRRNFAIWTIQEVFRPVHNWRIAKIIMIEHTEKKKLQIVHSFWHSNNSSSNSYSKCFPIKKRQNRKYKSMWIAYWLTSPTRAHALNAPRKWETKRTSKNEHESERKGNGRREKKVWVKLQCKMMSLNDCFRLRIIKTYSFQFEWPFLLPFQYTPFEFLCTCTFNVYAPNIPAFYGLEMNQSAPS